MDNQETLQTTVEDVIDLEEIERLRTVSLIYTLDKILISFTYCSFSSNSAEVSPDNCSRKQRSVTTKHYGHRKKLNCRHGYNIFIYPNGTVKASNDDSDKHCVMEFTSMLPGHVRIKGVEANLFLAMDRNGLLYGEVHLKNVFLIFCSQLNSILFK